MKDNQARKAYADIFKEILRPWDGPMKEALSNTIEDKVKLFNINSMQSKLV